MMHTESTSCLQHSTAFSHTTNACRECIDLLKELDAPVKHIILTTHAYEHKIFISPFQRRFPEAQVYVVPK